MRTAFMTVFLVVALQGMASAALASTDVNSPAPAVSASAGPSTVAGPDADVLKAQPSLRADAERKPVRNQPQVLSKNFQSPKPVQIYWFFGGR